MFAYSLQNVVLLASEEAVNPLRFDADLALFTLIIFIGLILVLGKFAWGPLIEGLNNREKGISDQMDSAEEANALAQTNLKQYEDKLSNAEDEAKELIAEARRDAATTKEKLLADAQAEADRLRERALADIEAAKSEAVRQLAEKSVDSAVSLAGSIVGRSLKKSDHDKLIDDSINSFSGGA